MRYTKANVVATLPANVAIQSGTGRTAQGLSKVQEIRPDHTPGVLMFSTTGAYEADE